MSSMQVVDSEEIPAERMARALAVIRSKVSPAQFEFLSDHLHSPFSRFPNDGLGHLSPLIMYYGKIGGAISRHLGVMPAKYHFRWIAEDKPDPGRRSFSWYLKPTFVEALYLAGWFPRPQSKETQPARTVAQLKDEIDRELSDSVKNSAAGSREARLRRLEAAPKIPEQLTVVTTAFRRNPDVIAEVLFRAKGTCESCAEPAPFLKATDGEPYLEVHHRTPLSKGGEDTIENAIALCPNCHRERHFGKELP